MILTHGNPFLIPNDDAPEERNMIPEPGPFIITAFVPLSGDNDKIWEQAGVPVPPDHPNTILDSVTPSCWIDLPTDLCPEGGIRLAFKAADDFSPDNILARQPYLAQLPELKPSSLPAPATQADQEQDAAAPSLDNLLSMVDIGEQTHVDPALKVLSRIFKNPQFKTLEAAWLGLEFLCTQMADDSKIVLSVIPVHSDNFEETLAHHRDSLIRNPPDLLLFDTQISSSAASLARLDFLVDYTDNLMTPGLAWLGPSFFNLDSWKDLDRLSFLPHTLDNPEYGQFRKIRSLPGSSWLCLCCNRVLGRNTHRTHPLSGSTSFSEPELPWISPIWAVAALVAKRICAAGLPTGAVGRRNRIKVAADPTDANMITETLFPEERVDQFSRCGIVPIVSALNEDSVFITDSTMLSGNCSLGQQFLTASLIHLVLDLHDTQDNDTSTFNLAPRLTEELGRHLKARYHTDPGKIKVSVAGSSSIQGTPLQVSWTPSEKILPATQPISFHFLWNPD